MVFSIKLWMPSWGGMINGLMTLNGAWDKVRTDPIIRMMVMALAFYGMSTLEGPMLSIKFFNSLCQLADSVGLAAMAVLFVMLCVWPFWPGSKSVNRKVANSIFEDTDDGE